MTFENACEYLYNANLMYGFSLEDIGNIREWNKTPEVEQIVNKFRCLHDIISTVSISHHDDKEKYRDMRYIVEAVIDAMEKSESCVNIAMLSILKHFGINISGQAVSSLSELLSCFNNIVNDICNCLSHDDFDMAYMQNENVHGYMDKYYSGVTYTL